uniref:Bladder cancer-associated protein n=1 Tax=Mesocestoides corti TaxID=53468 RepID=A0A5K3EX26_MESCO
MYCLQFILPIFFLPSPSNPAAHAHHTVYLFLVFLIFLMERKPCGICTLVLLALVFFCFTLVHCPSSAHYHYIPFRPIKFCTIGHQTTVGTEKTRRYNFLDAFKACKISVSNMITAYILPCHFPFSNPTSFCSLLETFYLSVFRNMLTILYAFCFVRLPLLHTFECFLLVSQVNSSHYGSIIFMSQGSVSSRFRLFEHCSNIFP